MKREYIVIDKIANVICGETYDVGLTALVGCLATLLKNYPNGNGPERLVMVVKILKRNVLKQDH